MNDATGSNPFSSPETVSEPQAVEDVAVVRPYESGRTRARWTLALLGFLLALTPISIGLSVQYFGYLNWYDAQETVTEAELVPMNQVGSAQMVLGILQVGLWIGAMIAYLMWVHRTYRNLPALGASDLSYSPGWAVGYYFIPIMLLFRPFQVMKQTWQASDPNVGTDNAMAWKTASSSLILVAWWFFHLMAMFADQASIRMSWRAEDVAGEIAAELMLICSEAVALINLPLMMLVVWSIDARQTKRSRLLGIDPRDN